MAGARRKWFQLGIKRALDVVVSASILVALSPLFLLTALAIMLETNGPVFSVTHENYYRRRSIQIVRFRTGEPGGHVGRMLTRSGLDRLPMLFNVLRGELSIIGPRCQVDILPSLVPDVVANLLNDNAFRPGLIGLELPDERRHGAADQLYWPGVLAPFHIVLNQWPLLIFGVACFENIGIRAQLLIEYTGMSLMCSIRLGHENGSLKRLSAICSAMPSRSAHNYRFPA